MSRDEHERLLDIKDAILAIDAHLARAAEDSCDGMLHDALLYQFVVIGEAVKHLTTETRAQVPNVQWEGVAGLRDLIAHEYFRIEIEHVRKIADRDVPPLRRAIDRLIRGDDNGQ